MPNGFGRLAPGIGCREWPPYKHRPEDKDSEQTVGASLGAAAPATDVAGVDDHDGGGQAHERGNTGYLEHPYFLMSDGPAQHRDGYH